MKQANLITIIAIGVAGMIVSAIVFNAILGDPGDRSVSFKTVEVVDSSLVSPDSEVFNEQAINPTVEVYVGECEDLNHDGKLDRAELVACGKEKPIESTVEPENLNKEQEGGEQGEGESTEEGDGEGGNENQPGETQPNQPENPEAPQEANGG